MYTGNAGEDAALDRGWILGHFKDVGDPRRSDAVEVKWGVHPRGTSGPSGCGVRYVPRCSC
ncbi:hypothetical protein GCM10010383_09940 [Streptomyces lomondensis]|uniref:Uncharacterized protein n=1 Tax=Streptomyces lomondensis TaxID=68229 RepID=A0ABQ2WZ74_9ACTN|nr:hypothetical protein GCM10010383_09940 [Streptomyces lomondensis]